MMSFNFARRFAIAGTALLVALVAFLLLDTEAQAASFVVDSMVDSVDVSPGDGNCADASGNCTLRAAVMEANSLAGDDSISVPAGTYQLTISGPGEGAGDLDISDSSGATYILGASASSTFLQAGTQGPPTPDGVDRVLDVLANAYAEVSGVTIRYGNATGSGNAGGGVRVQGELILRDSRVTENSSGDNGGGVSNLADVTIIGSTLDGNRCTVGGGGYYARGDSTTTRIIDSTIRGNECTQRGGGVELDGRFGSSTATILGSTIADNQTLGGSGGGGFFLLNEAYLTLANSTVSGNRAIDRAGGGLRLQQSFLTLVNSTITANFSGNATSGGLHLTNGAAVEASNSIIADNAAGADCVTTSGGTIVSGGYNLDSDGTCNLTATGDLPNNGSANLGPLQDNGGPTETHALLFGSDAIDAADDAVCAVDPVAGIDQRGVTRSIDGDGVGGATCDIGAFEYEPLLADLSVFIEALKNDGGGGGGGFVDTAPGGMNQDDPPPGTVWAGNEVVYRVGVFNRGPDTAINTTVTITLPVGVAYLADTDSCVPAGGGGAPTILTCSLGDIEQFDFVDFLIKTRVDSGLVRDEPTGTTVITAEASVRSDSIDANLEDNFDEDSCFVQDLADLKITKIVEPHTGVQAGEQFTYSLLVDNLGPSAARNVVITDTLVTSGFVRANGCSIAVRTDGGAIDEFNCNFNLATGVFDLGTFGANWLMPRSPSDMGRVIITINLTAEEGLDLTNVATAMADTPDPDFGNNMAMVPLSVFDTVDLSVAKDAVGEIQVAGQPGLVFDIGNPGTFPFAPNYTTSPTHATAGRRIRYRLEVTNDGPSTAENVVLTDRLPAGVTIVPGSLTISQGSCETGTPGDPLDRMVCGLGTMLPAGDEGPPPVVLTFDVQVDPSLDPATVLENDVNVYSEQFDPTNANNHAHTQTIVDTWADMEITKFSVGQNKVGYDAGLRREILEDLPGQVTAGHELRYEITVQNTGPSDARNVQILDLLPGQSDTGLDHDPITFIRSDGAYCRPADELQEIGVFNPGGGKFGQVLWCDLGTIPTGARVTFDIYVSVDPAVPDGFTLTNGAFVWWGASSPPANPASFLPFPFPQIPPELPTTDDPFLDDNFSATDTDVNAVADVYIQKVDVPASEALDQANEPDQAIAGNEHRYLITFGNHGWSVARDIAIQDFLDFKQFGILGENFLRCEPFDIDDFVSCSELNGVVDVDLLLSQNEQIIPGSLNPGDEFKFYLVTEVDPGYVLDADDFIATNDSRITTSTTDFNTANNVDAHDTLITAEADLSIEKTDVFGDPLVDPDNYFLMCDPVEPGGMITYDLTVTNDGPSDAADVYVVDQLPADFVAVDPAQVLVNISAGEVVEVRDDGRITIRLGNDLNNSGAPELGRLNAGSTETVRIQVMVRQDAECGGIAENHAYVEARQNDVDWPPAPDLLPGIGGGDRTPTHDPDETNNRAVETTTIECPKVFVNKTVSFDGQCPGRDITRINETGQPVTFCYEITNTGTTYLDTILITDTLTTRTTMPTVIFTDTITFGEDPKVPVAPGETVLRQVTVPHFSKECGIATDTVVVTAIPVNSGRTVLPCLAPVSAEDTAVVEIPCAGVDWRLALPILEQNAGAECEAWVQIQNVGDVDTKGLVVVWGDPGFCPPQAAGPLKVECTGLLRPGSAWTLLAGQVPNGARSAIVYSLSTERIEVEPGTWVQFADVICDAAFFGLSGSHFDWLVFDTAYRTGGRWEGNDFGKYQGEPLVASVNRSCPDAVDPNASSVAAYTGLSRDQLGARDPYSGAYMYYAPLIFASNAGLNTTLYLQNLGEECTSLEIWLKAQDNCLRPIIGDILTLAPGESVAFDPNTVVGPDWLGSAWIRATQPIAMVVDSMGANHFTSYVGVAADIDDLGYTYGNQVSFAPLIYSEYQGWDTAIQVQNLSPVVNAKVKVYFLDRSGDVITTLVDWICPRGSQTFFLPTIAALGGNWVGSARIESQDWWTPGTNPVDYPRISSVVLLEKWSDPARTTRREAVAYNGQTECLLYDWQVGSGKGGTQSGSAVFAVPLLSKGNRGVNSELAITNLVAKPGFTDFAIFLYDQNGLLDFVCEKLHDRQVEYIDLATWGYVPPNFLGSAVVSATFWEHDVFDPNGGFVRNLVGLGGVVVERVGSRLGEPDIPGDESKAFEAAPIFDHFRIEDRNQGQPPVCPGQPGFGP